VLPRGKPLEPGSDTRSIGPGRDLNPAKKGIFQIP
jgi:hypothetical protein